MQPNSGYHAKKMRDKVFRQMLETRGWKYRTFLQQLKLFKYLSFSSKRGAFLENYYTLMRYIDDIVDGDLELPSGFSNTIEFVEQKIEFSEHLSNPKDEIDYLMIYCFDLAKSFDKDFHQETKDILHSLLFDARRKGEWIIYPKKQLNHHFHLLDIKGTIKATLKIFNDDPEKSTYLEPLGIACRYQYDIEDIESDLNVGFINISKEECSQFEIEKKDLFDSSSPKIKAWLQFHAEEGMTLLYKHTENEKKGNFSFFERMTFKYVYENPARKLFSEVLSGNFMKHQISNEK